MPSNAITKNKYRKAKCCATCTHENARYCTRLLMPVNPEYVCDCHAADASRKSVLTPCASCSYGPSGDHSCARGGKTEPSAYACYAGRRLPAKGRTSRAGKSQEKTKTA